MPKVTHVKKARKDIEGTDIKAGDSYYWWKFRFGGKHVSKTPPKPSQLTQSDYLSQMYSLEEAGIDTSGDKDDVIAAFRSAAEDAETLGQEQSDKRDNMPDSLQDSETGELLQTRADRCEELAQALNDAADELEAWEPEEPEDVEPGEGQEDAEADAADAKADADEGWRAKAEELAGEIDWSAE